MADVEQTRESLERIQAFDPKQLARRDELGSAFHFQDAVAPAQRVIQFFDQIPIDMLQELTPQQRDQVGGQADNFWNTLNSILAFDPKRENALTERESLIDRMKAMHDSIVNALFPIVSYVATRKRDFSAIEREVIEAREKAEVEAAALHERLTQAEGEVQRILGQVRATAAEMGVSQQAVYFGNEADAHETAAGKWQGYTVKVAVGLGVFAALTLVIGKWILVPTTTYEAFQLGLSKLLVFATIAFMLFLSARTLMAHRHNRIVNKHRQNALLTFNALVEATHGEEARDIVLTHASACIFAPQESGFTRAQMSGQPLVEILPKLAAATGHGSGA